MYASPDRSHRLVTAVLLAVALLLPAGRAAAGDGAPTPLVIADVGDCEELLHILASRFMAENSDIRIDVRPTAGPAAAVAAVLAGQAGLARLSRPLTLEEQAQGLTELVFARAPVVFAVNPAVAAPDSLTREQVAAIFSGGVTDWSRLGGAPVPIHPVCRQPVDAARDVVDAAIAEAATTPCQGAFATTSMARAVDLTAATPGAIGLFPKPAVAATKLRILALSGVPPTPENVSRGTYPLSMPLTLVFKMPLSPAARRFIAALRLPDGRTALANYGCLPGPVPHPAPE